MNLADAYAEHLLNGPLTEMEVSRHVHLLAALQKLEDAMDDVAKNTPQEYRGTLDKYRSELRPIIHRMSVPYALVAEPVKPKIKRLPR